MDRARPGSGEASTRGAIPGPELPWPVHALFQRRVAGDDALLQLAGLRFAQMGVAAELYAGTPDELDHVLRFVPPHPRLPVVHLSRGVNVLHEQDRALVGEFARRFAGRIAGLVVHDKREMGDQTDRLLVAMRELGARLSALPDGPLLFLEYAAGLDRGWFVEVAERLRDEERVSCCIDIGHIGLRQATATFARRHPGLDLKKLGTSDARLPGLATDVQDAVEAAVPHVLEVTAAIGRLGKPVHFHLHDAHPLVPGLRDHFSFLTRLPVPFSRHGRRSLPMMYGQAGLATIVPGGQRGLPARGVLHAGGPPGGGPAAARRRGRPVCPLAGHHQCRTDELLALRAQRQRDAHTRVHRRRRADRRNPGCISRHTATGIGWCTGGPPPPDVSGRPPILKRGDRGV